MDHQAHLAPQDIWESQAPLDHLGRAGHEDSRVCRELRELKDPGAWMDYQVQPVKLDHPATLA